MNTAYHTGPPDADFLACTGNAIKKCKIQGGSTPRGVHFASHVAITDYTGGNMFNRNRTRRVLAGAVALATAVGLSLSHAPASNAADAPVDVLFVFDTTGSMSGALSEAKAQVGATITSLRSKEPNSQFAVAQIRDYGDSPVWQLAQPMTADAAAIQAAIDPLYADGGGDSPEAYGTALLRSSESSTGWRAGAKHLVVLVNDDVPHDDDLNQGVPAESQRLPSPFYTGVDPGPDAASGTADDVDWQAVLGLLKERGIIFASVLYSGNADYLPYWQWWTKQTGGVTETAGSTTPLGDVLVQVIESGISGGEPDPCPDVAFFGLRGSGQTSADFAGYGYEVDLVKGSLSRHLKEKGKTASFTAVNYDSLGVDSLIGDTFSPLLSWPFLAKQLGKPTTYYADSMWGGSEKLSAAVSSYELGCVRAKKAPGKLIIAGYSQGAAAADWMSRSLTKAQQSRLGLVLIGDPLRQPGDKPRLVIGSAAPSKGLLTLPQTRLNTTFKPQPQSLGDRTVSLCNKLDIVCDTANTLVWADVTRMSYVHTHYDAESLRLAGVLAYAAAMK